MCVHMNLLTIKATILCISLYAKQLNEHTSSNSWERFSHSACLVCTEGIEPSDDGHSDWARNRFINSAKVPCVLLRDWGLCSVLRGLLVQSPVGGWG